MPMKHSPRRSPRLDVGGAPATATTTATATGKPASSASVAGDRQRPQTPKESGVAASEAASNLQPAATGQLTDSTTVQVAALMERIAHLESELVKARANEGHAEAARDPVGVGARGVGVSGTANTPPCLSETVPCLRAAPRQGSSESLPRQIMSDNLQPELGVTPSLDAQLPAQLSASLPPQLSGNLAPTLGGHWANGQPVTRSCTTTTVSYSPPFCVTATAQPERGYVHPPREPTHNLEVSTPSPLSYGMAATSIPGWTPRRLPDLPEFEGQPEEWPIFLCAFTETTAAYQCTDLENNQRLVKALKGEARAAVKSLLIHPSNVQAVMEQLRFRYGRPELLIRSQLESVRDVQPIQEANIARIVPFATRVSNLAAFLQSTTTGSQHLGNPTLMEELIAKLPVSKRLDWAKHAATIQPYPTVVHLSEWLHEFAKLVCTVTDVGIKEHPRRRVLHANSVREEERYADRPRCCPLCEGQHSIKDCKEFNRASTTRRIESAKRLRLCFSCLEYGHMARFCTKDRGCNVYGCRMRHHYLLHDPAGHPRRPPVADGGRRRDQRSSQDRQLYRDSGRRIRMPQSVDSNEKSLPTSAAVIDAGRKEDERRSTCDRQELSHRNLSCVDSDGGHLLFRILPVTLYGENTQVDTYALLDEGSSVTLIDDELIRSLNLRGESRQLNVQWFGGKSVKEHTRMVSLQISAAGKPKRHALKNVYGVANLSLPMQSLRREDVKAAGARSLAHLGIPFRTRSYGSGGPYAAATPLGWVVYGPVKGKASSPLQRSCLLAVPQDNLLEKMVSDYFEIESFGVKPAQPVAAGGVELAPSVADDGNARALSILEETTKRVGRRYETGLLWRDDEVRLPESYSMALNRLVNIERKMKRDVDFARAYKGIMDDYVKKGYARRLEPQEVQRSQEGKVWYLPHFGVENPNKPGKIRLVFDAAAKVNGVSLNSALMKGPQRYKPLPAVLFHFREGAVGVCADIKEMFHQVLMQPKDRCAQRFLWRNGEDRREPDIYEMQVMTFGAACSPCSADYVKTVNASQYSSTDPRAVLAINEYHYVDDYVDSFPSEEEAIAVSSRVRDIHAEAGFNLCRFTSSSASVVRALNPLESIASVRWTEAEEKVLGMYWQPATDDFKFGVKYHRVPRSVMTGERVPTKREFLSLVMSTFDPIGFLSCYMVTAKVLMREIWRRGVGWDEPLPDTLAAAFESWRQGMKKIEEFRCPRYYFGDGRVRTLQLHIFVDSSQSAFAAAAYWRATYASGDVQAHFICSKTKCAPMRTMSIPRLELQAAVLGTRLMDTVKQEHGVAISSCVLWTDSKTVLHWISSTHRRYKQFVGNRVTEILESTEASQWRWIPSAENVADDATRPRECVDLSIGSRWLSGPPFLRGSEESWPRSREDWNPPTPDEEEMKCEFALVMANFISLQRFSSYNRLVRSTAWVLRFIRRCRGLRSVREDHGLTSMECAEAERTLIRQSQREAFAVDSHGKAAKGSRLYGLSPYFDKDGVMRASGRIDDAACVPYSARRPIILSHEEALAEMIVQHHHEKMCHQNVEATIGAIRQKFWITNLRRLLRKVMSNCNVCKLRKARPTQPEMGPLPEDRLEANGWPFKYTGLDYFGPLFVTVGRHTEKRWVALFTCLTTRAIHLEMAHDLSTDSCIIAMRNFMSRRGPVVRIRSDNGKNFVGADREARKFSEVFEPAKIQGELSSKGIEWIFNCPANPAEGGVWERMVQCVKKVLAHTIKELAPKEHVLENLLIEAESIVNSRPLTHLPVTVDQEAPLTPNDLLKGVPDVPDLPKDNGQESNGCATRKQWRIARMMRDRFWKRWVHEYLPTLVRRERWCKHVEPIRRGDLVFICDPAIPRREWKRGVVEEVFTGRDGIPRRAAVRTNDRAKTMMRPASRLAVLDVVKASASRGWGCRGTV
ncbi:uncharacterized protein LOC122624614 [Drosophila teissieri]|uniref:uncharacterized protein LOC122624614 n=1 Tax=Drosophila teissieri TaxID=7243 RepID=UPI001CBA142B|nr:uncharacterized protein LOC122624614 [Drosophila teissieri]